jgi:hypothetical protein
MVCAIQTVSWDRPQVLQLFDYETKRKYNIPFNLILSDGGLWRGDWRSPWILLWGFDDDGNLLFKIIDTIMVGDIERPRCVQGSFNLENMRKIFSVEVLENIEFSTPWNFQLFSDQCWGYPVRDNNGDMWCVLRDLRDGNLVCRVGPLNARGTTSTEYIVHISMFHVMFQDKTGLSKATNVPAHAPLRIFSINPLLPAIHRQYNLPDTAFRLNYYTN